MWNLLQGKQYDPDAVYGKATDGAGHSNEVRIKLPPQVEQEIAAFVASRAITEYRTIPDLVRDAITHRLHYLHQSLQQPQNPVFTEWMMRSRIEQEHARLRGWEELTTEILTVAEQKMSIGDLDGCANWLAETWEDITNNSDMPIVLRNTLEDGIDAMWDRLRRMREKDFARASKRALKSVN